MPTLNRLRLRAGTLLGAGLLAAVLSACGASSQTATTPGARTEPLVSMFEAQGQLLDNPTGTLDRLVDLGVDSVRVFVPWASLAPDATSRRAPAGFRAEDPAAYPDAAWQPYDGVVRAAAARHVTVDLTLEAPPPLWASGSGAPADHHPHAQWRPNAADYGRFVHAVAERYSGTYRIGGAALPRVSMWSIWNEPNYGPQLAPQATERSTVEVAPALYRSLVDAAWHSLGATGHGRDTILIGELAPRGQTTGDLPGNFAGMVPLRFLRALYCLDGSLHRLTGAAASARDCPSGGSAAAFRAAHPGLFGASGYALHLYAYGAVPPNNVTPDEPDYADLATVGRFASTIDRIVAAYGASVHFPIYDTEFGYKTNPPYSAGAPPATAAEYLNWAEYLHWRDPRLRSYDQYLLIDPPAQSQFATGLLYLDGRPKASLQAFQMPLFLPVTRAATGTKLEIWGCVRPADTALAQTGRAQVADLQFASSGGAFRTIAQIPLTAAAYFDMRAALPGSGTLRVRWMPPHGPALVSRTVAVTLH